MKWGYCPSGRMICTHQEKDLGRAVVEYWRHKQYELKLHMDWLKVLSETSMGKCLIRLERYFPNTTLFILHRHAGYIVYGYRFMQGQDLPALKWMQAHELLWLARRKTKKASWTVTVGKDQQRNSGGKYHDYKQVPQYRVSR